MWRSVKFAATLGFAVVAMISGAALKAQKISMNPYHVNYNWDKLQGRNIGVVSGIRMDADRNLYIADRGNDRVQVIDKDGDFKTQWTQFGKPSAVALDNKGNIYVADGMSNAHWNPGWERGIRVADIKTGWIKAFIPDEEATEGAGTDFLGVDINGVIYSGASGRPGLVVHTSFRPLL
jgi:sugar lactone lactonase YvrE